MPVFQIRLPEPVRGRAAAEVTLARNIGLLSGIPDVDGGLSWVCEYDAITLRDLARGAPQTGPASRLPLVPPASLTPSTMNTFGPDTKAAAVLAGANVLLTDFTTALDDMLKLVVSANEAKPGEPKFEPVALLACWAAGVLTGYRACPLLFVNALKARAIQRVLAGGLVVAVPGDLETAPAEYGGHVPAALDTPRSPTHFAALDESLLVAKELLRLDLSPDILSLLDSIATAFGRLLLRVGGPREGEPAIVWAYENRPGRRAIDSVVPTLRIIKSFIGEQSGARLPRPVPADGYVVPRLPDDEAWSAMPSERQRLLIEIYTTVLRWLREEDVYGEESAIGQEALRTLSELAKIADAHLPPDDAVRLECVTAAATAELRRSVRKDESISYDRVRDELATVRARLQSGGEGIGLLLETLSLGAVALNRSRTGGRLRLDPSQLEQLESMIIECWRVYNVALRSRVQITPGASAAGYHLHSYAGFLGGLDDVESLRTAVDLYRRYILPSRRAAYVSAPRGNTLRLALQVAARSAMNLAAALADGAERDEAIIAAEFAVAWAGEALQSESAAILLDESSVPVEANVLFASAVLRSVAEGVRLGVPIDRAWLGPLELAVRRSHAWILSAEGRSEERIEVDAALDALFETTRAAARD